MGRTLITSREIGEVTIATEHEFTPKIPSDNITEERSGLNSSQTIQQKGDKDVRANFNIGFDWIGPGSFPPVHENIAIAAFTRSNVGFPFDTTYNRLSLEQWEYIRGIIWNDDPSCLLFKKSTDNNHRFGIGADFFWEFTTGSPNCMTQRSHFHDLQFLHAMGSREGELPNDTRKNILDWMGVMYRLACGNQGVQENDPLKAHLPGLFNGSTNPPEWFSLRDLILATTPGYRDTRIPFRALGICLHIIQDSYAKGHVQRQLLNPKDLEGRDSNGYLYFRPTTWGQWGPILSFHTYKNQNTTRHGFYDGLEGANMPDPRNLDSFNRLSGARDAIEASINFINAYAEKQPWDKVCQSLVEGVFALDDNARPCNTDVDDLIGLERFIAVPSSDEKHGFDNQLDRPMQKLAEIESGEFVIHGFEPTCATKTQTGFWKRYRIWVLVFTSLALLGKLTVLLYLLFRVR